MKPTSTKSFSSFEETQKYNFEGIKLPEEFFQGELAIIIGYKNLAAFVQYLYSINKLTYDVVKWVEDGGLENVPDFLRGEDLAIFWQANLLRAAKAEYCITGLMKETHHIETYLFPYDCEAILDLL